MLGLGVCKTSGEVYFGVNMTPWSTKGEFPTFVCFCFGLIFRNSILIRSTQMLDPLRQKKS